jgi:adenylate cyclase
LWHLSKASAEGNALAEKFFQQAIDLDPTFAGGYKALALAQNNAAAVYGTLSLRDGLASAEALARQAVALDNADAEARARLGMTLWMRGDYDGALAETQRALAISPNLAYAHGIRGSTLVFSGQPKDGIAALETCIRLDPRDPNLAARLNHVALGFYLCGEYEAAIEAAKRAIRSYPNHPLAYRWLAAALGQVGRIDEARDVLAQAIAIAPASFDFYARQRVAWMRPQDHAHWLEGIRKAGWEG